MYLLAVNSCFSEYKKKLPQLITDLLLDWGDNQDCEKELNSFLMRKFCLF